MTYLEFKTLFERYLKRNDLSDMYGDFTKMAEARINAVMRLGEMESITQLTPTSAAFDFPSDFIELRHIQSANTEGAYPIEYLTPEQADDKRRWLTGQYKFYTIIGAQIEIIPHPTGDSTTEIELYYYAKPTTLTTSDGTTNDIATNYPNLYLYAAMGEAALYREAAQQSEMWLGSFDAYAVQLNDRAQAARFSGNSMQMRAV